MTKFGVIKTGGKQYKVSEGDSIKIEKIKSENELKEGSKISFDNVLLIDDGKSTNIGNPLIKGAKIEGTIEKISKHKKIHIVKFKSKSRYTRKIGHRQPFFEVKISKIA